MTDQATTKKKSTKKKATKKKAAKPQLYTARLLRDCDGPPSEAHPDGKVPAGTVIKSATAFRLCRPTPGNGPPMAEPADNVTAAKVQEEVTTRLRNMDRLQGLIDSYPRDDNGKLIQDKLNDEMKAQVELAKAYNLQRTE